jgi:DNA-binding LytR/AlgR family response regulator
VLHIAICNNINDTKSNLESYLLKIGEIYNEKMDIDVFYSRQEFLETFEKKYYDVVYIEVEFDHENGIRTSEKIREEFLDDKIQIIFIANCENYAMRLFKIRPMDFLIRPFKFTRVLETINILKRLLNKQGEFFEFKSDYISYKIPLSDIIYFENSNRKVNVIADNRRSSFYGSIDNIKELAFSNRFIQIHKSYLVNMDYINKYEYHQITMKNGDVLPISQPNRKRIRMQRLQFESLHSTNTRKDLI